MDNLPIYKPIYIYTYISEGLKPPTSHLLVYHYDIDSYTYNIIWSLLKLMLIDISDIMIYYNVIYNVYR